MRTLCERAILALALALAAAGLPAHEHHPPHRGSLQVFGKEMAHLELLLDSKGGRLTAYALDGEAEKYVRLSQRTIRISVLKTVPARKPFELVLHALANPLTGETEGDSSQFEAISGKLAGVVSFEGRSGPVTIRGIRFKSSTIRYPEGNE